MILLIAPIPLHLIPQLQISLLRTVTYTPKRTVRGSEKRNFTTKEIISIFPLWTLPGSIIPAAPAYGVYISKLIRYSRTCGSYRISLMESCCQQGSYWTKISKFGEVEVITSTFFCPYHDFVNRYGIYMSPMTTDMFHLSHALLGPVIMYFLSPDL